MYSLYKSMPNSSILNYSPLSESLTDSTFFSRIEFSSAWFSIRCSFKTWSICRWAWSSISTWISATKQTAMERNTDENTTVLETGRVVDFSITRALDCESQWISDLKETQFKHLSSLLFSRVVFLRTCLVGLPSSLFNYLTYLLFTGYFPDLRERLKFPTSGAALFVTFQEFPWFTNWKKTRSCCFHKLSQ